jgi:hypothetical protein
MCMELRYYGLGLRGIMKLSDLADPSAAGSMSQSASQTNKLRQPATSINKA